MPHPFSPHILPISLIHRAYTWLIAPVMGITSWIWEYSVMRWGKLLSCSSWVTHLTHISMKRSSFLPSSASQFDWGASRCPRRSHGKKRLARAPARRVLYRRTQSVALKGTLCKKMHLNRCSANVPTQWGVSFAYLSTLDFNRRKRCSTRFSDMVAGAHLCFVSELIHWTNDYGLAWAPWAEL
jgi:hypothetical protein